MSEAIERRMLELGLSPGDFAKRARLQPQGLDPVRKGRRRSYQRRTLVGVARALRWPLDWYEQLQAGEDPANFPDVDHPDVGNEVDERLSALEVEVRRIAGDLRRLLP